MKIKDKVKEIMRKDGKITFVPYVDSAGNELWEEDIVFESASKRGRQQVEMWSNEEEEPVEGVRIYDKDIRWCSDAEGTFPVVVKTKTREVLSQKISAKTGEKLPMHAGCAKQISVKMFGAPNCGKTTYIHQLNDPALHNEIARGTSCFMSVDDPYDSFKRQEYEKSLEKFQNKILPDPTLFGEEMKTHYYYIVGPTDDAILTLGDASGEECLRLNWDSKILNHSHLIYMIEPKDLQSGKCEKLAEQVLPKLNVVKEDKNYKVLIVITKSDLLDKDNELLKEAFENSISYAGGKLTQITHAKGFDYKAFNRRSNAIRSYIADTCPNFYNKLIKTVPEGNLSFAMIASIGEECHGNTFENYCPFCIDEPILKILTEEGLYPIAEEDVEHVTNPIPGFIPDAWIQKFKEVILFDEEEDEED